jgi:phosphoribosylglycinamide formyltransferase-1
MLFRGIRSAGVKREIPLVIETLRAFADGRIRIENRSVVDSSGASIPAIDLSPAIEESVASNT